MGIQEILNGALGQLPGFLSGIATGLVSSRLLDRVRSRDRRREAVSALVGLASGLLQKLREVTALYDRAAAEGAVGVGAYFRMVDLVAAPADVESVRQALSGSIAFPVNRRVEWHRACDNLDTLSRYHEELRSLVRLARTVEEPKAAAYRRLLDAATTGVHSALRESRRLADRQTKAHIEQLLGR